MEKSTVVQARVDECPSGEIMPGIPWGWVLAVGKLSWKLLNGFG